MAPRRSAGSAGEQATGRAAPQFDLFPTAPVVEALDARHVVGPRTAVEHLVRVRLRPAEAPHLIFHDRHGWYCEAHGPACHAVSHARAAVIP